MAHCEVGQLLAAFKLDGYADIAAAEGYEDISELPDAVEDFETLAQAVGLKREHASRWGTFVAHCLAVRSNANVDKRNSLVEVARPEELLPPPPLSIPTSTVAPDDRAQSTRMHSPQDTATLRESMTGKKTSEAPRRPSCKACGSPWTEERGFFRDGRHSRSCRVCAVSFCPDCKFLHMLKAPAHAYGSDGRARSHGHAPTPTSTSGGGAGEGPWVCRACAQDMGFFVNGPCIVCKAPWVNRSSFLGRNSMHSRECLTCLKSFCHSCKNLHMVKEGTSAAVIRLSSGRGNEDSFSGSVRGSVVVGESMEEAPGHSFVNSESVMGVTSGSFRGSVADSSLTAPRPSSQAHFRRYECLDCRAEHAYLPMRASVVLPPQLANERRGPRPDSRITSNSEKRATVDEPPVVGPFVPSLSPAVTPSRNIHL